MKKEELLELGIDEDVAKQVMALHGKTVTTLNGQISSLEAERDGLQEQVTTNQSELETLKESAKGNEELTQRLTDLQTKLEQSATDSETRLAEQKKDFAIQLALKEANALDENIVLGLLDRETIKVTDSGLQGLSEQLEGLKESKGFLFQNDTPPADPTPKITTAGNAQGGNNQPADAFQAAANKYI
ncbi:phage scaffolding protein [uncultured Enterococcus sp.]|uniref:phage scaffolding protein n=1 Tax=uncultured Enterococcus sp. TaxID=167972 RepID=UPI002AA8FA0A|nr:phage scaffolding protein [uncultured Enterococcus sp.]